MDFTLKFKIGDLVQMVFPDLLWQTSDEQIALQYGVIKEDLGNNLYEVLWTRHLCLTIVHESRLRKADKKCP